MGRSKSGLWVNGWFHEYAVGRQAGTGRIGAIFHEPARSVGAAVVVADPLHDQEEPWICGCDSFPGAVFSTVSEGEEGWTWELHEPGGVTELYFWFEAPVKGPGDLPPFRTFPARAEVDRFLVSMGWRLTREEYYGSISPVVLWRRDQYYARYMVVAAGDLVTTEGCFPSFALPGGAVLALKAAVRN